MTRKQRIKGQREMDALGLQGILLSPPSCSHHSKVEKDTCNDSRNNSMSLHLTVLLGSFACVLVLIILTITLMSPFADFMTKICGSGLRVHLGGFNIPSLSRWCPKDQAWPMENKSFSGSARVHFSCLTINKP